MSCLDICRVCLSGNISIQSIRSTPLQVIFEKLTNYKLTTEDGRPETVCYICWSQLQRYRRLIDKALKSKQILTQLLHSGIQISRVTASILSRRVHHDFCVTPVDTYSNLTPVIVKNEVVVKKEFNAMEINEDETVVPVSESDVGDVLCGLCLVSDITVYAVENTPQVILEILTDDKLAPAGVGVCYICRWWLLKCRRLISKITRSERILTELFRNGIRLTKDTVIALNSRMKTSFITISTASISYTPSVEQTLKIKKQSNEDALKPVPKETTEQEKERKDKKEKKQRLECGDCGYTCYKTKRMQEHLQVHNTEREYKCNICSKRYLRANHLRTHIRDAHKYRHKCTECSKRFTNRRKMAMHMLSHAPDAQPCDICDNVYKDRRTFTDHKKREHPEDIHTCTICKLTFATKVWLQEHALRNHTAFSHYECDICGKRFIGKISLKRHILSVHIKKSGFICDVCGKNFYQKGCLKRHMIVHADEKPFQCDLCRKSFCFKANYEVHIQNHKDERSHRCKMCDKRFNTQSALNHHIKTHDKAKYTCNTCGQRYANRRFLTEHMLFHVTGERKTHACLKCGKTFPLNEKLKIHMYTHKPKVAIPKIYDTCTVCQKKCLKLSEHMRIHSDVKAYACEICNMTFRYSSNLSAHLKIHTKRVKNKTCSVCSKSFYKKYHLDSHMSIHTGIKLPKKPKKRQIFPCDTCGKQFTEKRSLECHITQMHSEKTQKFICDMCFKVHTDKGSLILHMRSHARGKLGCIQCKRTFSEMSILAQHMRKHKGAKNSACSLCGMVYNRTYLWRHYKMSHGGLTPVACNICEEGFPRVDLVFNHFIKYHYGDKYSCGECDNVYRRRMPLIKHIAKVHAKNVRNLY